MYNKKNLLKMIKMILKQKQFDKKRLKKNGYKKNYLNKNYKTFYFK